MNFLLAISLPFATVGLLAFICYTFRKQRSIFAVATLSSAVAFLCLTLVLTVMIIRYGLHMPLVGGARFLIFAWIIMLIYFVAEFRCRIRLLGSILMPIALTLLILSTFEDKHSPKLSLSLGVFPTFTHVALVLLSFGLIFLSFAAALLYLIKTNALKNHLFSALDGRIPSLPVLRRLMETAFDSAFPVLTLGMILGTVYASSVLNAGWIFDSTIIWGLLNWLFYSILFFLRQSRRLNDQRLARGIILLFVCIATSFMFTTHKSLIDNSFDGHYITPVQEGK